MKHKKNESGRSMVEMLGVLAIVGVLSVGAIGGYSYGMDKYRANMIINDVNLRAVDAIAQFDTTGDVNLNSWPTTTAGGYAIGLEDGTIGIQVDNVPERICEMVFDGMINNATIKIGTTEYDSATDDNVCGDTNTMVFYVDEISETENDDNNFQEEPETENEIETETTTATEPETTTAVESCNCGEGQYCADKNFPDNSCEHPTPSGECKDASAQFRTVDIDGTTYYISNNYMSWWDAVSACKALGNKRLLSPSDLVNGFDETVHNSQNLVNSALGDALYEAGWGSSGYRLIWSSILFDSCSAYLVSLNDGIVGINSRNYDDFGTFAVCR